MTIDVYLVVLYTLLALSSFQMSKSRPQRFEKDGKPQNITIANESENKTTFEMADNRQWPCQNDSHSSGSRTTKNTTQSLDASGVLKELLRNYDRRIRPLLEVQPLTVYVNMFVSSMEGLKELTMDFSMTIYFRQWWRDPRLAYDNLYSKESITVGGDILSEIWLPDTHFEYAKSSKDARAQTFLLKLWRNGTLMWSRSDSVTTTCAMNLRSFPMDTQSCNFSIESFGYGINDVIYKWRSDETDQAIQLKKDLTLSKFMLWKINKFDKVSHYDTGSFSGIIAEFTLTRRTMYYIMQIYLPCAMIVFLSWISFWIDSDSTPARISLGITTVLSMTTLLFGVQSTLPKVPYVKSLDVYMFVSFTLVFASLIEYACVHYYITKKDAEFNMGSLAQHENGSPDWKPEEKESKKLLRRLKCGQSLNLSMGRLNSSSLGRQVESGPWPGVSPSQGEGPPLRLGPRVNSVDRYSRILFPLVFLIFNIIYWPLYML